MGTLVTDFTLIKPGALHQANGGYLILSARRLLLEPLAYEALKKAIRTRQIRIESLAQLYGMASTVSLDPEPVPLDTKIILLGERSLYYLLSARDPDFDELFKVAADFDDEMERNQNNHLSYAGFVSSIVSREKLRHLDKYAVARMIEYGSRLSGDSGKLSTHIQSITDLVNESNYYATKNNHDLITCENGSSAIRIRLISSTNMPSSSACSSPAISAAADNDARLCGEQSIATAILFMVSFFGAPVMIPSGYCYSSFPIAFSVFQPWI